MGIESDVDIDKIAGGQERTASKYITYLLKQGEVKNAVSFINENDSFKNHMVICSQLYGILKESKNWSKLKLNLDLVNEKIFAMIKRITTMNEETIVTGQSSEKTAVFFHKLLLDLEKMNNIKFNEKARLRGKLAELMRIYNRGNTGASYPDQR